MTTNTQIKSFDMSTLSSDWEKDGLKLYEDRTGYRTSFEIENVETGDLVAMVTFTGLYVAQSSKPVRLHNGILKDIQAMVAYLEEKHDNEVVKEVIIKTMDDAIKKTIVATDKTPTTHDEMISGAYNGKASAFKAEIVKTLEELASQSNRPAYINDGQVVTRTGTVSYTKILNEVKKVAWGK